MRPKSLVILIAIAFVVGPLAAQQTPPTTVEAYAALADTILSVRATELRLVADLLDGHRRAAKSRASNHDWEAAAAEIALFANEGDNAVAGIRKRLLEGGHHFNAEGEDQGMYEPGYVIVTKKAKHRLLELAKTIRQPTDDQSRMAAMTDFEALAGELLDID